MREDVKHFFNNLKTDSLFAVSFVNTQTNERIVPILTNDKIIAKYGSLENLLERFLRQKITQITAQEFRKAGTSHKKMNTEVSFSLLPKTYNKQLEMPFYEETITPTIKMPHHALQAPNVFGLGFTELVNITADAKDKTRLETENKFLTEEKKRLESEILSLKEEKINNLLESNKKSSQNELLLGVVNILPSLAGMLKNNVSASGLNAPIPVQDIGIKGQSINIVRSETEEYAAFILQITEKINNETFYNNIINLLNNDSERINNEG